MSRARCSGGLPAEYPTGRASLFVLRGCATSDPPALAGTNHDEQMKNPAKTYWHGPGKDPVITETLLQYQAERHQPKEGRSRRA